MLLVILRRNSFVKIWSDRTREFQLKAKVTLRKDNT